jgi:hypothetical protein
VAALDTLELLHEARRRPGLAAACGTHNQGMPLDLIEVYAKFAAAVETTEKNTVTNGTSSLSMFRTGSTKSPDVPPQLR